MISKNKEKQKNLALDDKFRVMSISDVQVISSKNPFFCNIPFVKCVDLPMSKENTLEAINVSKISTNLSDVIKINQAQKWTKMAPL